jgi:hypothetical protein
MAALQFVEGFEDDQQQEVAPVLAGLRGALVPQPESILLTRRAAESERIWWLGCYCSASADTARTPVCSFWPIRDSDAGSGWYVKETAYDASGKPWERFYSATVDDFGNLVEVSS